MRAAGRGLTLVIVALVAASAWAQTSPSVDDLLQMLRAGGYVIVFRHGATYLDQADTDPLNPGNIAQQRQLNDKGRADAEVVGERGLVVSPNENNRRTQALRAMLAASPDAGTNTLIVTHKPNIVDALGKDWFEIREGEASVFKPEGSGKYALVARIQIGQWATARR